MSAGSVSRPLWKAVAAAAAAAAVLLLTVVLPAEYGIDPTSVGRVLGLTRLSLPAAPRPLPRTTTDPGAVDELSAIMNGNTVSADPGTHREYASAFTQSETTIHLAPLEEVELKARMEEGDALIYTWESPAPVYVDTHGEPLDYPASPAVRYVEKDGVGALSGRITAPFAGLHGWYWLNTNEMPVTITLKTSGYYRDLEEVYRKAP